MQFSSIEFSIFLPIIFILYWFVTNKNIKIQNALLLVASYIFYGWWDWRFLSLIIFSSLIDYNIGLALSRYDEQWKRKLLLQLSIAVNLGLLGFFKYFNFFAESFADAFSLFGKSLDISSLNIILPVGISFYTFQTLSYTIDIYQRKLAPTNDIISFFAFVSFFPQLVAGPIERARNLLPQFNNRRTFSYEAAVDGLRQILWGLFKKLVIADNCANYVNNIFSNSSSYSGSTLLIGGVLFAFQIYGDFSGYSDIAIGTSRLFGFNLMKNFSFPYFSRDIGEFWRRWHISLSTWFRDYLYIPLGGSMVGMVKKIRNIFIIFILSGFWHGANWTFIIWGILNAIYFLPLFLLKRNRRHTNTVAEGRLLPSIKELIQIITTFSLTTFAWIFFRSDSVSEALKYLGGIFNSTLFTIPILDFKLLSVGAHIIYLIIFLFLFVMIEWIQRDNEHALSSLEIYIPKILRWTIYYGIVVIIFWFRGNQQEFIYFQF